MQSASWLWSSTPWNPIREATCETVKQTKIYFYLQQLTERMRRRYWREIFLDGRKDFRLEIHAFVSLWHWNQCSRVYKLQGSIVWGSQPGRPQTHQNDEPCFIVQNVLNFSLFFALSFFFRCCSKRNVLITAEPSISVLYSNLCVRSNELYYIIYKSRDSILLFGMCGGVGVRCSNLSALKVSTAKNELFSVLHTKVERCSYLYFEIYSHNAFFSSFDNF